MLLKISAMFSALYLISSDAALADAAGDKISAVVALDKTQFTKLEGYLFQSWLQMDENDRNYVVYIGQRKYKAILDDGRGTTEKANNCMKENFFDEDPTAGCSVSFDGEYLVEDNGGSIEVSVKIWNVTFN